MKAQVIKSNVGADLSKDDFKACYSEMLSDQRIRIKATRTFKNTLKGFRGFLKWIDQKSKEQSVCITVEATGVYHEQLVYFLHEQSAHRISVVLANKSNAYARSLNIKQKTDPVDAKLLAQMGLERMLKKWEPMSSKMLNIKQLTRDRITLLDEKTAISNRLHALKHSYNPDKSVMSRMKKRLKLIEKQVKEVENQITKIVHQDTDLKKHVDQISKVKGLGLITIVTIIAETNGFALFTSRAQLTSYTGYDVVKKQSGSSVNGKAKISKKGNKYIRRALHFPAITAVKYEEKFKRLFERVYERTAIKMKGYVAVQRKLLLLIFTLFKKNEAYDPNFVG